MAEPTKQEIRIEALTATLEAMADANQAPLRGETPAARYTSIRDLARRGVAQVDGLITELPDLAETGAVLRAIDEKLTRGLAGDGDPAQAAPELGRIVATASELRQAMAQKWDELQRRN